VGIHIFGDESGVIGNQVFLIGLLFVESDKASQYEQEINRLKVSHNFNFKELHYSDLSPQKVDFSKAAIDWFFSATGAVFKCTVVRREMFDTDRFQKNLKFISADEMSYNVIYKGTIRFHLDEAEKSAPKVIIVDKKDKARPDEFERFIRKNIPEVKDFQEGKSEDHNLLQIADLLVGCVNGDLNNVQKWAKRSVITHLKIRLNVQDFTERNAYTKEKFRVAFWKPPVLEIKKGPTST
jgi:hypothetical protein